MARTADDVAALDKWRDRIRKEMAFAARRTAGEFHINPAARSRGGSVASSHDGPWVRMAVELPRSCSSLLVCWHCAVGTPRSRRRRGCVLARLAASLPPITLTQQRAQPRLAGGACTLLARSMTPRDATPAPPRLRTLAATPSSQSSSDAAAVTLAEAYDPGGDGSAGSGVRGAGKALMLVAADGDGSHTSSAIGGAPYGYNDAGGRGTLRAVAVPRRNPGAYREGPGSSSASHRIASPA